MKKPNPPDRDLGDVIREETHRGRPGIVDTEARRRLQRQKEGFRELLRSDASEAEFAEALIALGHEPGTVLFEQLLHQYHEWKKSVRGF